MLYEQIRLQHELTGRPVVVLPVLVSTVRVSQEKLPRDLAGLPIVYTDQGLLPQPQMGHWVESRVCQALHATTAVEVK